MAPSLPQSLAWTAYRELPLLDAWLTQRRLCVWRGIGLVLFITRTSLLCAHRALAQVPAPLWQRVHVTVPHLKRPPESAVRGNHQSMPVFVRPADGRLHVLGLSPQFRPPPLPMPTSLQVSCNGWEQTVRYLSNNPDHLKPSVRCARGGAGGPQVMRASSDHCWWSCCCLVTTAG